jgi:hypothetical protein
MDELSQSSHGRRRERSLIGAPVSALGPAGKETLHPARPAYPVVLLLLPVLQVVIFGYAIRTDVAMRLAVVDPRRIHPAPPRA